MQNLFALFRNLSLRTHLILWFLLLVLLPLGWTTFISYELSKKIILDQSTNHLRALSLRQAQLIETYFKEKERNAAYLAKDETLAEATEAFRQALMLGRFAPSYQTIEQDYRSLLAYKAETLGYRNMFLLTKEGDIVFSLFSSYLKVGMNLLSNPPPIPGLDEVIKNTTNFLEIQVSPLLYFHPTAPTAFISVPTLKEGKLEGVVLVQLDNLAIYRLIGNYNGLGNTGETILVGQDKKEIVSITPLRNLDDGIAVHEISSASSFGKFIQQVLNGQRLVDKVIDYRDKETLMVGRHFLPALNLGIITKMDTEELLAPINKLKYLFWILGITTAAIVALVASNVAKEITHPLLILTEKTRLMAAGDLSQRIDNPSKSEIGRLGESFNDMASQLNNMIQNLDTLVATRTQEVEMQNIQLEQTIDELQQTQNRLITQEKLASLGALTAGIAHEIKNPLNFINNFAELSLDIQTEIQEKLSQMPPLTSEDEKIELNELFERLKLNTTKIFEHGKRADSIVRNMLQHSRGTPGEKDLTNLNALLDEYVGLSYHGMRAQDMSFNVKIEKAYDQTLPLIPLVPQEMSRVFLNLLNNAYYTVHQRKQLEPSSFIPTVRVSTENHQDHVVIKIWDNGMGMSEEVYSKLFTPFFTTKPTGEGTGLGLSLSYNIVVQGHQGTLIANTSYGQFTELVITLPFGPKQWASQKHY